MIRIHVESGEELVASLERQLVDSGIKDGAVVSLIGALDSCVISNMPANDAQQDVLTEFNQPFELSGTGEIVDGKAHLHVVLGQEGNQALAGHLHWAKVDTWFVNVYVEPLN